MYTIVETDTECLVVKDEDTVVERYPYKPWEHSCNSLAKLKAIEYVRKVEKHGTYFDFMQIISKVRKPGGRG